MPRLREAFQEHGTETAYVDVGTANQGFSDGKSTASEDADKGASDRLTAASDDIDGATENRHAGLASDEDGLNILV
jgi:flagellar hook-length control protein FliK